MQPGILIRTTALCLVVAQAGKPDADVVSVTADRIEDNLWEFHVTVEHPDTGWDDYANGWDVVLPDGTVAKAPGEDFTRLLGHPHVDEQPFTRSATVEIPAGVKSVTVRAHDLVHGWGGKEYAFDLATAERRAAMRETFQALRTTISRGYWFFVPLAILLIGWLAIRNCKPKWKADQPA